jgi:hypothetical protein
MLAELAGVRGELCAERSIVETAIGRLKNYKILAERWQSPSVKLQEQAIMLCCELTQLSMMRSLSRPSELSDKGREVLFDLSSIVLTASEEEIRRKLGDASN